MSFKGCEFMQKMMKPWLHLFYIWGMQWIANGILDFFNETSILKTIKLITLLLAVLASLLNIFFFRSQFRVLPQLKRQAWLTNKMLFPFLILIGSMVLLWYIAESDSLLIFHVLRALLLAFFYVMIGALLGKELIWLGCWLFGLVVIVSVWYLGYAPFVFEGMGGLSLLTSGWILQRIHREYTENKGANHDYKI
jgi:hypothetical protein